MKNFMINMTKGLVVVTVLAQLGFNTYSIISIDNQLIRIDRKVQELLNDIYKREQEQEVNTMLYLEGMYENQ